MKLIRKGLVATLLVAGIFSVAACSKDQTPTNTTVNNTTTTAPTTSNTPTTGITTTTKPVTSTPTTTVPVDPDGKTIYADPNGVAEAAGTYNEPFDILTAFNELQAGDTLILKEGTYNLDTRILIPETQNGTAQSYISVKNEDGKKVIIDFSNQLIASTSRGIQVNADYWYFYGLEIKGAGDNGMYVAGSYNVVEYCEFHENQDAGFQLGRAASTQTNIKDWPSNNLIKNCTSYNNYDYQTYGENADGFAAKLTIGEGNIFDGCIAYRNADDGWDLYAKTDSGNIGTVIIKNCVAFENGWLLEPTAGPDDSDLNDYGINTIDTTAKMLAKTTNRAYTTRDGDGIGFKLGGSVMEGNVIIENCLTFNNRLHGISDNSNPGVLSIRNCTSYNNSVTPDPETGAVGPSNTENKSNNFDTARTDDSYNNYYGLLSYTTNQTEVGVTYSNSDAFKGSVGYSIFCLGKNKYTSFTKFQDASSYEASKQGSAYNRMSDDMFESVNFQYDVNGNRNIHELLRNSDGSINVGPMMNVVDEELLTYCEGDQIGAKLNYTSWEDYDHYYLTTFENSDLTAEQIEMQEAIDVLTVMCNEKAVYQNLKLLTIINGYDVTWTSSNELVVEIGTHTYTSVSNVRYVEALLTRDRNEDKLVTLTATISNGDYSVSKDFEFNIKRDIPTIGDVVGMDSRYILTQFQDYTIPSITVLNGAYYSEKPLIEGQDYNVDVHVYYATSSDAFDANDYFEISKIYTSVSGVYKVVYTIHSLISDDVFEESFFAYVVSENADIDMATDELGAPSYEVNVSRDGVTVQGKFTNILGDMYIYTTNDGTIPSATDVIEKGQQYDITDETLTAVYPNANDSEYAVHIVVTNKTHSVVSQVYSSNISVQTINSEEEFHNLVTGSTDQTTIYLLTRNLDFTGYNWLTSTQSFGGLFNGNGYTIANLTVNGLEKKDAAIFYKIKNGTIMNVNFENITINGAAGVATVAGIVGQMTGGYIHNVGLKNITVSAHTGSGGMVGQVSGGVNYISQVSLVNDENATITVTNKYCGGIVGNVQKDSDQSQVHLYVSNCYVEGTIGNGRDAGGYVGGIIGRAKNDFDVCYLDISQCYFFGKVMTGKNYAAGIFAGSDNGAGDIRIIRCVSNCTIYYAGTWLDGLSDSTMAVKNGSPIYGRYTTGLGEVTTLLNYGSFADAAIATDSELFFENIITRGFWATSVQFDLDNVWSWDEEAKVVTLRTPSPVNAQ